MQRCLKYVLLCAVLWCFALSRAARLCEESGYCSQGVSKHWVGDILAGVHFRDMLQAVSYKKELIMSVFLHDSGDGFWVDQALQLHFELEDHGYSHHIFVSSNEESCSQLNNWAAVSCVWDSMFLPDILGPPEALWHQRWKFMGRATRLGYNVMSIDADFMFFQDPYVHLKREPFSQIQLIGAPESLDIYNCNGGFMYVHNARSDGPATWVFKQVAMSTLRRADDNYQYMAQWAGFRGNCLTFDQSIILDALVSASVGLSLFPEAFRSCKRGKNLNITTRFGATLTVEDVIHNMDIMTSEIARKTQVQVLPDSAWLRSRFVDWLPFEDARMFMANLTVPNLNRGYPEELGGRFAPVEAGPLSQAFTAQLKDDCPECSWWPERRPLSPEADGLLLTTILGPKLNEPDMYRGDKYANLRAFYDPGVPQETMAQAPLWLVSSLGKTRRGWILGRQSPVQGPLVMGHIHAWHMQEHRAHKTMVRKVYGRYNWTLGSHIASMLNLHSPYSLHREVTHVLALSPRVDLSRTRSWEEYASIITGLMQVAFLTHRVLLLPDLPCQAAWVHSAGDVSTSSPNKGLVCIAPMFYENKHRYPLPTPLAVDQHGELVGGWARRLRQLFGYVPAEAPAATPPILLHPRTMPEVGTNGMRAGFKRRQLLQAEENFWSKQRYVVMMPGVWDPSCTRDMHAITSPEFFHWRKHTEVGRTARPLPDVSTLVFVASPGAESLRLNPPQAPGGDSATVPAGSVVQPSSHKGWSWYDVQASVSAKDVHAQLQMLRSEPLVFVDHPVMVVHDVTDPNAQADWELRDSEMAMPGSGVRALNLHVPAAKDAHHFNVTPDETLSAINFHFRRSHCKANWVEPETHLGILVPLARGQRCRLEQGVLHPISR